MFVIYPRVAIIILNWNGWKDTLECLESLYQITYPNYSVILVDNGSKDDSLEQIRDYSAGEIKVESSFFDYNLKNKPIKIIEYSREETETYNYTIDEIESIPSNQKLILIKNEKNYGFAEGNNIGIRFSLTRINPDYILLLNNDTVVDDCFLEYLVEQMENNEKIGFCSPKIYYYVYDGKRNVINFAGGRIDMFRGISSHIGVNTTDVGQYDLNKEVDWAEGSCMVVRRKTIEKVGLLDSKYFAYWEELDWCMQGKKYGWQSWYIPEAKIWHKIARSTEKMSGLSHYYMTRNRIFFMRKNSKKLNFFVFVVYFFGVDFLKQVGILIIKRDLKFFNCFLRAVMNGFYH